MDLLHTYYRNNSRHYACWVIKQFFLFVFYLSIYTSTLLLSLIAFLKYLAKFLFKQYLFQLKTSLRY